MLLWIGLMTASGGGVLARSARAADADPIRAAITQTMTSSALDWSRNDLDGFMAGYEDSPETSYVTGQTLVRGFAAIKAMYAAHFVGRTSLGKLSFTLEEVRPLGSGFALAVGRFGLMRDGLPPSSGIFTLVFHHAQAGWKIISDHTSG